MRAEGNLAEMRTPCLLACAVVAAALLGGCTGAQPDRPPSAQVDPQVDSVQRAPTPTPTPTRPPVAAPFNVVVDHIDMVAMGNSGVVAGRPAPVDPRAAEDAVHGARQVLQSFLNRQFVSAETRFSGAPIRSLLAPGAMAVLDADGRLALGMLDIPVVYTKTGAARARAQVALDGAAPHLVTLEFEAHLDVVLENDAATPLRQHGMITFAPTDAGWRGRAVDVHLEGPGLVPPPPPSPPGEPSVPPTQE